MIVGRIPGSFPGMAINELKRRHTGRVEIPTLSYPIKKKLVVSSYCLIANFLIIFHSAPIQKLFTNKWWSNSVVHTTYTLFTNRFKYTELFPYNDYCHWLLLRKPLHEEEEATKAPSGLGNPREIWRGNTLSKLTSFQVAFKFICNVVPMFM